MVYWHTCSFGASTSGFEARLCHLIFYLSVILHNFWRSQPKLPFWGTLGSNDPSARRPGQRFHFLQCRGSSPSLCFVNRHGGTLRRAGWVAFTKTYSRGKWLISHLPLTFAINYSHPACPVSLYLTSLRPRPTHPRVPCLMSSSPSSRVPKSQVPTHASRCPRPLVPVPLLYTTQAKGSKKPTEVKNWRY